MHLEVGLRDAGSPEGLRQRVLGARNRVQSTAKVDRCSVSPTVEFPDRADVFSRSLSGDNTNLILPNCSGTCGPFPFKKLHLSMSPAPMRPAPLRRLVLFHGLASTPKEFGLLVHPLRRLGVTLDTPEVRGYSHGSLAEPSRWQDWVSAAADTVEAIAARSPEPFVLGGLCTGAMLAVAVAVHRSQPKVQGLALLSPLFSYDGWGLPWWYGLRHWAYLLGLGGRFSMRERPPYGLKNERVRQWVRKQMETEEATMVGPAQVSLQVVRESERLSRHVIESLRHLSQPMLVLHARQDEICDFQSVKAALSSVAPQRLRMRVLENSYHLITADNDRQQVADSLDCFLKSAVPSPPCMAAQSAVPTTDVDGLRAATPSDLWTLSTNSSN